jgi:hypothetical protein
MSEANDEIVKKARLLADATGRDFDDVLEDLMDDGVLNDSNRKSERADLVTQLKEAAELITTVQSISTQVSENTVLNGGDNKTEVKVETTLEGDIVDRAIASAQRKADNFKKLLLTLTPIFLLLTGGAGLEVLGITDMMSSDDSDGMSNDQYNYEVVWGCTVSDAENYDPYATDDDGSCWWDDNGGNDCYPDWWWQNEAIYDYDNDGQGFNNDLQVQVTFQDKSRCDIHMNNGYFEIRVGDDIRIIEVNFHDEYTLNEHYFDLPAGDYYVIVSYETYDGSSWGGPETWVTMESDPETCEMELTWKESNLRLINGGHDLEVEMIIENINDCEGDVAFMFSLYRNNSYQSTVEYDDIYGLRVTGYTSHSITFEHASWQNLGDGEWSIETRFRPLDTGIEDCCQQTNSVVIEPEPEPEPCNNLVLTSNSLTLSNQSNNLYLEWELNHDGPDRTDCYVEVEIMITIYLNGSYHSVNDFKDNGVHRLYATQKLWLDRDDVAGFNEVSEGTWEILAKYRIVGESSASQDYFANSVTIEA